MVSEAQAPANKSAIVPSGSTLIAFAVVVLTALLWSYWQTACELFHEWQTDENYSVGQLVPLAAIYLAWQERKALSKCRIGPCWWGIVILIAAHFARMYGLRDMYQSVERYAMVLSMVGAIVLVLGSGVSRRLFWILLFLFLMVPLPGRVHNLISAPLQDGATTGAVFLLEVCGTAVLREGNVLILGDDTQLAVAEACSGLRMLTAFVVVGCVLAGVVSRPFWQKAVLCISTVPVAIVCNMIRLLVTAWLFQWIDQALAARFVHDFAGWAMMPLAIVVLAGELWLMNTFVKQGGEASPSK